MDPISLSIRFLHEIRISTFVNSLLAPGTLGAAASELPCGMNAMVASLDYPVEEKLFSKVNAENTIGDFVITFSSNQMVVEILQCRQFNCHYKSAINHEQLEASIVQGTEGRKLLVLFHDE